ncbi:MAG TPA: GNAT family N-acetyltransferase [Acidimicrobiia bacterium]|nr:GNAT family N-acetyltransferase [Acidimicrobiia bacterium]
MALTVTDQPSRSRYELRDDDRLLGFTEYDERDDGVLVLPHTVITEPKRGAGYGGTLVRGALDDVRAKGRTIVAECPFVKRFIEEHPDYQDLLA